MTPQTRRGVTMITLGMSFAQTIRQKHPAEPLPEAPRPSRCTPPKHPAEPLLLVFVGGDLSSEAARLTVLDARLTVLDAPNWQAVHGSKCRAPIRAGGGMSGGVAFPKHSRCCGPASVTSTLCRCVPRGHVHCSRWRVRVRSVRTVKCGVGPASVSGPSHAHSPTVGPCSHVDAHVTLPPAHMHGTPMHAWYPPYMLGTPTSCLLSAI